MKKNSTYEEILERAGVIERAEARAEARTKEEDRRWFLELLKQGLSYDEIEKRLSEQP